MKITFIGGDERMLFAAGRFAEAGMDTAVYGFGISTDKYGGFRKESALHEALQGADVAVLPLPYSQDEKNIFAPFVLDIGKTPFRRATIYLNEVKIGRFIRSNSHQTKFYLPPEFLKEKNNIKIVIWEKSHRIKSAWDFKNYIRSAIINIEPHKIYQLQKI